MLGSSSFSFRSMMSAALTPITRYTTTAIAKGIAVCSGSTKWTIRAASKLATVPDAIGNKPVAKNVPATKAHNGTGLRSRLDLDHARERAFLSQWTCSFFAVPFVGIVGFEPLGSTGGERA